MCAYVRVLVHFTATHLHQVPRIYRRFCIGLVLISLAQYAISFFLSLTLPIDMHLITDDSHKYECDTHFLGVGCNRIYIAHYYCCCYDFSFEMVFRSHTHANNKEHLAKSKPSHCVTVLFQVSLSLFLCTLLSLFCCHTCL